MKLLGVLLILMVVSITPAYAHNFLAFHPENFRTQEPLVIDNPTKNWFTLEEIQRLGESHFYTFNGIQGERLFFSVRVPDQHQYIDFRPSFDMLFGNSKILAMPINEKFTEEFSRTEWRITAQMEFIVPQDGIYTIRLHDELGHYQVGDIGKFAFVTGQTNHDLTIIDWIHAPITIVSIAWFFEEFVQVAIWFFLILIVVIAIIAVIVTRRDKNG